MTKAPALSLSSQEPFVVAGRSFGAGETVRVVAIHGAERLVKVLVAGSAGGFRARFAFAPKPCSFTRVSATGSRGSRASLRILPACQPPPLAP